MDALAIAHVRSSFAAVTPCADAVAARFYERLFDAAPQLRALFPHDMRQQRAKLVDTLAAIVADLDRPEALSNLAGELGQRHVAYGTQPGHYRLVGVSLIEALRDALGGRFTASVEAAWRAAYRVLAAKMIEGATGAEPFGSATRW